MSKTPSVDDFDFIQLVIHDVHGAPKGRMLSKSRMSGIIKNGLGIYLGVCFFGIEGDISVHSDFSKHDYGNKLLKPVLSTLRPCPSFGNGKFKVGQVICRLEHLDGRLDTSTPRTSAEIQIERLKTELDLTIKSAFEFEFAIRKSASDKYFGHVNKWASTNVLEDCQEVLFDMIHELRGRGVQVDSIQTEYGPGQYEVTLDVAEGIETPDTSVAFKNIVKTFMKSRGYDASFMTRIDPETGASNASHFNHSVWTSSGANALYDENSQNQLSELGRHWLAGLIEHAPAMTAFCNPTINCYRRIGQPWAPTYADWSCHGRLACFRLKVEGGGNVYIENRLSTGASNPYLVLICTIAAGMDGVKRKLPLPKAFDKSCLLPTNLESALKALESDTVLTQAMGDKLVEYFIHSKKTFEIEKFKSFGELTKEEHLEKELEMYFFSA